MFKANNNFILDIYDGPVRNSRNTEKTIINELNNLMDNLSKNKEKLALHKITPTHCATAKDMFKKGSYWKPMWVAVKKCKNDFKLLLKDENFKKFANVVSYDGALENVWFAKELIKLNKKLNENIE